MAEKGFKRKLTAILSADVVGYSRLMREDEEATVRDIAANRVLIAQIIQQHRGRVVDSPGDNILAEFASVVDAVNGAIKIQDEIKRSNTDTPKNRRMEFRIGVNLGDVIEEEERIYGDGVNIAARVEGLAAGAGIAISGAVYEQIKEKLSLGYHYLGEQDVKNISEPIRVYRLLTEPADAGKMIGDKKLKSKKIRWAVSSIFAIILLSICAFASWYYYFRTSFEPASMEKMAFPLPDKPSIAVLPCDNMSGDPDQEYFSDGITEQIISSLSKIPKLFVVARNSTFTYKGRAVKIREVAEELGVQYVMEGSVQKSDNKIRITAQLIDALTGHHIWTERYERDFKDIFALQDEITTEILKAVQVEITEGHQTFYWAKWGTDNLKSFEKNLQGIAAMVQLTKQNNIYARQLFEEAIDLDPKYIWPYVNLGWTHFWDVYFRWSRSPEISLRKALELAQKTLAMDDRIDLAHSLLGSIYYMNRKYEEALAEAERAVSHNPNGASAYMILASMVSQSGRWEDGIVYGLKAIRLNPVPDLGSFIMLGRAYFMTGQYEESISWCKKALNINPNFLPMRAFLAACYSSLGRQKEAEAEAEEIIRTNPEFNLDSYAKTLNFKDKSDIDRYILALRKAGLPEHPPLKLPDKPSIAVLPFVNMSGDPEQEYFSDGLTDELIGDLAKISGILVISRNSAFTYKGKQIKIEQIAKELNVRYVLEGSVQKSGDKVRIRAQLIDGQTDHHLWAESYDGVLRDIFDLQDKITSKIVSALAIKLTPSEQEKVADKGTKNVLAYEAFLKGEEHFLKSTLEDFLRAIEYYKEAIKFDPNFSRAYAAIGGTYQIGGNLGWGSKMGGSRETIRLLARNYLELAMKNPSPEAYSLAAAIELHRRNFQKSIFFAEKAYNYAPNSAGKITALAWKLAFTDRTEDSIELLNKAIRLDPLDTQKDTPISFIFIGVSHFGMGNLEEAINYLEKGLSINPKLNNFSCFLAASHALLGNDFEAKKALAEYLKIFPKGFPVTIQLLYYAWPFKDSDVFDRFAQGLVKAGLQGDPKNYFKLSVENKLSGQEIRKLLFGRKSSGYVWGIKALKYSYAISDQGELEYSYKGKTYTGKAWIDEENICQLVKQYHGGFKDCHEIYSNPEGDQDTKSEYFRVTDYGFFLFSVE